jgi:hypothetical protein
VWIKWWGRDWVAGARAVRRDGSFDRRCGPGVEWSGGLAAFGYTVFTAPMVRMYVVALAARPHVQNVFPALPRLYLPADNHILPSLGNLGLFGLEPGDARPH